MEKQYINMRLDTDDGVEIYLKLYIQPKNLSSLISSFSKRLSSVGVPDNVVNNLEPYLSGKKTGEKPVLIRKAFRYYVGYMFLKQPSKFRILGPGAINFTGMIKRTINPKQIMKEVNEAVKTSSNTDEIIDKLKENYKAAFFDNVKKKLLQTLHVIADKFGWYAPPSLIKI